MSSTKNPDVEPFPYPPSYQLAVRNPTALTVIGAVILLFALGFFGYVVYLVVAPSETPLAGGFIALAALGPIAGGVVLWIGIVRLRWQRSYLRRHGVMPVFIGQRQKG
jgi:membrane associated rhomboid family serine protease